MKIAYFHRLTFEETEHRFKEEAEKMGIELVFIKYKDLVLKSVGQSRKPLVKGHPEQSEGSRFLCSCHYVFVLETCIFLRYFCDQKYPKVSGENKLVRFAQHFSKCHLTQTVFSPEPRLSSQISSLFISKFMKFDREGSKFLGYFLVLPARIELTFRASEARVLPLYYGSIEKSIVKKEEKAMKPLLLVKVLFITRV